MRPDQRPERHRLRRRLRSCSLQEPQTERREHQHNPTFTMRRSQNRCLKNKTSTVDHDGYQREHVKHDAGLPSHRFALLLEGPRRGHG